MKRIFIGVIAIITIIVISSFTGIHFWTEHTIKSNIETVRLKYPGDDEDALIAYLKDTTNTFMNRSHIAIWTLGQIKSEKSLPILQQYYLNDPKGNGCYKKHTSVLCQYEIYKAMKTISE